MMDREHLSHVESLDDATLVVGRFYSMRRFNLKSDSWICYGPDVPNQIVTTDDIELMSRLECLEFLGPSAD